MAVASSPKGKKRAYEEARASSSSLSPLPLEPSKEKKLKRAETRKCPICEEPIPLRLLATHAELESERLEEIIKQVGSTDILLDDADDCLGPSSRSRRSALRARKTLSALTPRSHNPTDTLEKAVKAIQTIKRRRKHRHAKLRDMAREHEEGLHGRSGSLNDEEIVCPICLVTVRGDQDVLDAHIDACLADQRLRLDERMLPEGELHIANEEEVWEERYEGAVGHVGNVRGAGFHTRNRNEQDVDDEVDVDGDDQFGDAQFTEGDILPVDTPQPAVEEEVEVDIEDDDEDETQRAQKTLRALVAEGKVVRRTSDDGIACVKAKVEEVMVEEVMVVADAEKMDFAILGAQKRGDKSFLIKALENKVKQLESMRVSSSTSILCRICLDPYTEPTVSTGCWHTCCRECWLRCLGSTKLCPICKRITAATDLRRVYL